MGRMGNHVCAVGRTHKMGWVEPTLRVRTHKNGLGRTQPTSNYSNPCVGSTQPTLVAGRVPIFVGSRPTATLSVIN